MLKAVLFDMGDTLFRYTPPDGGSVSAWVNARLRTAIAARYPALDLPPPAAFSALIGQLMGRQRPIPSCDRLLAQLAAETGWPLDPTDRDLLTAWHDGLLELPVPEPDLAATLDALQAHGLRLGIISNTIWRTPWRDRELARHGLLDYFPVRLYSADWGMEKPDSHLFAAALAALGDIPPAAALYVGDDPQDDIAGAHAAGLWTAWLPQPGQAAVPPVPPPDLLLTALRDLPALLTGGYQPFLNTAPLPA